MRYSDGDPTGRDRSLFCQVGQEAAEQFFGHGDPAGAADIMEAWTEQVALQVGEHHPDIGRASLLMSVFMTAMTQYPAARGLASVAVQLLEQLGERDSDFQTAVYLAQKLDEMISGTYNANGTPIIAEGTPAGDFLIALKR